MAVAFLVGAVASGFAGAALTALGVWIATVISGSSDPWGIAPWLISAVAAALAVATYVAERIVYRRTVERKRATGEPWAYRD